MVGKVGHDHEFIDAALLDQSLNPCPHRDWAADNLATTVGPRLFPFQVGKRVGFGFGQRRQGRRLTGMAPQVGKIQNRSEFFGTFLTFSTEDTNRQDGMGYIQLSRRCESGAVGSKGRQQIIDIRVNVIGKGKPYAGCTRQLGTEAARRAKQPDRRQAHIAWRRLASVRVNGAGHRP